ncbi:Ref family recombination enhancement nuclease [Sodalis sp. C49]|uniref:Ref family recombination enhancement nuclease n=1 Tax=Sodalis sp. C49 TaxID=3228929 RepID=UPI003965BD8E
MTKADRVYLSRVVAQGCIVCRNVGYGNSPAEIHHLRTGQGAGQRASHQTVIPLCPQHHRLGGYGVAIHAGQRQWESRYGTELQLLAQVRVGLEQEEYH